MSEISNDFWERAISNSIMSLNETRPSAEAGRLVQNRPSRFVSEKVITSVRTSSNRINIDATAITRPTWSLDRLPVQTMPPVKSEITPITTGKFIIQPSLNERTAYISPTEISLLDFSLTLRRSVLPDRGLAITGGSAFFSISAYAPHGIESISLLRKDWNAALKLRDLGDLEWSYRPEQRRGLSVSLELPPGVQATEPLIFTSPVTGVATVTVELTESGALIWKTALEQGSGSTIAGVFHVNSMALGIRGVAMRLDRRSLDTTVGRLLADRGVADIHYVDPQQTVQGKLIIVMNDLVEKMTVAMRPNMGQAPTNQTFGPEGGQIEISVSTQDVSSVAIDWTAQVAFNRLGWPVIPVSGRLTSTNIWTDMIKPDSWIASYTLMAVPVDDRGQAQTTDVTESTSLTQGVLNFTAPYVANGLINSSFQVEYLRPINIALPRFPDQPFGDLVLSIFATRSGVGGSLSRKLNPDELNIVVLVYPNAHIEIYTGSDALAELSSSSEILRLMESVISFR